MTYEITYVPSRPGIAARFKLVCAWPNLRLVSHWPTRDLAEYAAKANRGSPDEH